MPDLKELRCAVIGSNVEGKSRSPDIHREFAAIFDLQSHGRVLVYDAINLEAGRLRNFVEKENGRTLHQVAITMPHKVDAASISRIWSPAVERTAAANTLTRDSNGHLIADNTDVYAAEKLVADHPERFEKDRKVLVYGSGGIARAWSHVLQKNMSTVDIYNPDIRAAHQETAQAEAAELARSFGHSYMPNHWGKYDVLINCSPLGEERPGLQGEIPVNMSAMAKHALVIDMVYNGPNGTTPLIRNARTLGHEVSTGFSFLLSQAIEQFRLNMHYTVDAEQAALIKDQDYLPRTRHAVRSKGLNPFSFGRIENMDLLDQLAQTKKCYARHVDGKTEIFAASREIAMQIYDSYVQMTT